MPNVLYEISDIFIEVCDDPQRVVNKMAFSIQHNLSAQNMNRFLGVQQEKAQNLLKNCQAVSG